MKKSTDLIFRISIIVKGVDAVFEVVGGLLLTQPVKIARYLAVLAQHELYRHHQVLSGRLDHLAETISVHASLPEAAYLCVHGLAKVILIVAIFLNKRWGYVGLIGVLSLFTLVELTRSIMAREIVTGLLGLFDLVVVILIAKEYQARFGAKPQEEEMAPG
ncbi:MAG TPA: DUF2127 domain-containing protein [Chthonomonadaceae bacterium]|nr:DUF2127 domain-containing protein [Chthonomonadaceae bacterium]